MARVDELESPGRRSLLAAGTCALLAGGGAAPFAASAATGVGPLEPTASTFLRFDDPVEEFKAHFRYERDLRDEAHVVNWYHFTVYVLPNAGVPQPLVRYEGMEFSYFRRLKDLVWRIHAHNVSFPRRLEDGAFATEVLNPVTGRRVRPATVLLLEDPGVLYSPAGYALLDAKELRWMRSRRLFRIDGDTVVVDHTRPKPEGWPKQFLETSTSWVARAAFDDPTITSLPCHTSGFYLSPFPRWMEMGDVGGSMIGAWNGRKLRGVDELPGEFRSRLARERPDLLQPRWGEFERPLPFAI
jgi:hypothetical protein